MGKAFMKRVSIVIEALSLGALPGHATEWSLTGFYISGGAGFNLLPSQATHNFGNSLRSAPGVFPNWSISTSPAQISYWASADVGASLQLGLGKKFDNGMRWEIEGSYRTNRADDFALTVVSPMHSAASGTVSNTAIMSNVLYEFNLGLLSPYVGAGFGLAQLRFSGVGGPNNVFGPGTDFRLRADGTQWRPAYQAIAGVALPLADWPRLRLTMEYRYFTTARAKMQVVASLSVPGFPTSSSSPEIMRVRNENHSVMLGVRYDLH